MAPARIQETCLCWDNSWEARYSWATTAAWNPGHLEGLLQKIKQQAFQNDQCVGILWVGGQETQQAVLSHWAMLGLQRKFSSVGTAGRQD